MLIVVNENKMSEKKHVYNLHFIYGQRCINTLLCKVY